MDTGESGWVEGGSWETEDQWRQGGHRRQEDRGVRGDSGVRVERMLG